MVPDTFSGSDIATAIAAWLALILSIFSIVISWKTQRLAQRQEERRKPILVPYFFDGYVRFNTDPFSRIYAFLVSVSNPSDSDNAVAEVDLQLTYTTQTGIQMKVKMRADPALESSFGDGSRSLQIPARVDAHQTVSGWTYFRVEEALLKGAVIDGYSVVLNDSHGNLVALEPIMVREYGDDIKAKPRKDDFQK